MIDPIDIDTIREAIQKHAEKIESIISSYTNRKEQLVSLLQDIQSEYNYLPQDVLVKVSQTLDIPLSQVFSIATFFQSFTLRPRGRHMINICTGTACHVQGAQGLVEKLERDYALKPGETTKDERFTLQTVNCLGCCALGPVVVVDGKYESQVDPEKLDVILDQYE